MGGLVENLFETNKGVEVSWEGLIRKLRESGRRPGLKGRSGFKIGKRVCYDLRKGGRRLERFKKGDEKKLIRGKKMLLFSRGESFGWTSNWNQKRHGEGNNEKGGGTQSEYRFM